MSDLNHRQREKLRRSDDFLDLVHIAFKQINEQTEIFAAKPEDLEYSCCTNCTTIALRDKLKDREEEGGIYHTDTTPEDIARYNKYNLFIGFSHLSGEDEKSESVAQKAVDILDSFDALDVKWSGTARQKIEISYKDF